VQPLVELRKVGSHLFCAFVVALSLRGSLFSLYFLDSASQAYEKREVKAFLDAIDAFNNIADDWLKAHMAGLVADFHRQYILKFVKPYRRLRISCLAAVLFLNSVSAPLHFIPLKLQHRHFA